MGFCEKPGNHVVDCLILVQEWYSKMKLMRLILITHIFFARLHYPVEYLKLFKVEHFCIFHKIDQKYTQILKCFQFCSIVYSSTNFWNTNWSGWELNHLFLKLKEFIKIQFFWLQKLDYLVYDATLSILKF